MGRSLSRFWNDGAPQASKDDVEVWEETLHPLFDSGWAPLRGLLTREWHFVDAPRPELYDRAADPADRTDVASGHGETVASLRLRLRALGESMGDVAEPEAAPAASPEDKERRERLASLGYASLPLQPEPIGGRLDPKDGLPGFLAVEEAERLVERGEASRAVRMLQPFLRRDPTNPRLWHTLSKARVQLRDLEAAESAIRRALALSPALEFLRYTHADIARRRGDERTVVAELEAIVRDNPRAVDASLELAAIAIRRKDRDAGKATLLASYHAGSRDPDLLDRLGHLMLLESREPEARTFFAESLALWSDDPTALLATARADLRDNDPASAIERLRRCATGINVECRMELARAYVVGPRDLAAARRELVAARKLVADPRLLLEVDRRLAAVDGMTH
jgi:Flp pilus assembly protein TadD